MKPNEKIRADYIEMKIITLQRLLVHKSVKFSIGFVTEQSADAVTLEEQIAQLIFTIGAYKNVLKRLN